MASDKLKQPTRAEKRATMRQLITGDEAGRNLPAAEPYGPVVNYQKPDTKPRHRGHDPNRCRG
jgi:hypothetical protein